MMDDDASSVLISGNLDLKPMQMYDSDEEEDEVDNDVFEDCIEDFEESPLTLEEIKKAEETIAGVFGVTNFLTSFVRLLIFDKLPVSDLAVQNLVYKVQKMKKGAKSVRYLPSWGMFWAGVRNLSKSRSLVAFTEHFCIPSRLSKFKDKIINLCGLDKKMMGKPGLQKENVQLFVRGKQKEIEGKPLCVSVSIDAKKIAVTEGRAGREDMGGLGSIETPEEVDEIVDSEKQRVSHLLETSERQDLFSIYDLLSKVGASIVKMSAVLQHLVEMNSKKLVSNPRLNKYIFILNQKLVKANNLLESLDSIQSKVIKLIARKRNCLTLTPVTDSICLNEQDNYTPLYSLSEEEDIHNLSEIEDVKQTVTHFGEVSWKDLQEQLSKPLNQIPRGSRSFDSILSISSLRSDQAYKAAGLSRIKPLQDMKSFYHQYQTMSSAVWSGDNNCSIVATFCSNFAPMSFGSNMLVREAGLYVGCGVVSSPNLVVVDKEDNIVYSVVFIEVDGNTTEVTEEMITTALLTSHSCNSLKGCLLVLHSVSSLIIHTVPSCRELSQKFLTIILSYCTATKCLSKRSKELNDKISIVKSEVRTAMDNKVTLGCYPIVKVTDLSISDEESVSRNVDIKNLKVEILGFLDGKHSFETKSARELIAVNISDVSGVISKYPHTILAGVFLSSGSLKVLAKDILK